MPMLPSSSSALFQLPVPGRRSKIDASSTVAPPRAGQGDRDRGDVDADAEHSPARERVDVAPGAAADVQHRAASAVEHTLVHGSGPAQPHVDRQRAGAAALVAQHGLARAVEDRTEELERRHATPVSASARAKRASRCQGRDGARVRDAVDVAQRGYERHAQSELTQPRALGAARPRGAHRHAEEGARLRRAQADGPVAAVGRGAEHRVDPRRHEAGESAGEFGGRDLRRVHADEQGRPADVRERVRQALVEAAPALRDDLDAGRQPVADRAVQHDYAPGGRRRQDRIERVRQRCAGQRRRVTRGARRAQPRLAAPGSRGLGQHHQCGVHARARAMSLTARAVPRTVPVTFERPTRGR